MKPPTSSYGCGSLDCEACNGDAEWQISKMDDETLMLEYYLAPEQEGGGVDDPSRTWTQMLLAETKKRNLEPFS